MLKMRHQQACQSAIIAVTLCSVFAETDFEVDIRTDSRYLSGTHAKINMKLKADGKESETFFFQDDRKFHRGRVYQSTVSTDRLGDNFINEVEIGHDNSGSFPGWGLEQLQVKDTRRQILYKFSCKCWVERSCYWRWSGWWPKRVCTPAKRTLSNPTVDGIWSAWSTWSRCRIGSTFRTCRTRRCDNPPPQNVGLSCVGPRIEYRNRKK